MDKTRMLIMMTSGPDSPHRLGMPFFQAMAALAAGYTSLGFEDDVLTLCY